MRSRSAQSMSDMAIALAIEKGQHKFIDVKLIDLRWKETLGWHKVIPVIRLNTETQMDEHSVKVSTGALVFKYDEIRSGFYAKVLDDAAEENRKRLAANAKRFMIVDEELREEIFGDLKPEIKEPKPEETKIANVKPEKSPKQEVTEPPVPETTETTKGTETETAKVTKAVESQTPEVLNTGVVKTSKPAKANKKGPVVSAWAQQQQEEAGAIPGEGTIVQTENAE